MCAFRGVARLVLQSLLKTEGLNWVAVVPPLFSPYNNSCLFPQGQIFCPVCSLEKLQEKEKRRNISSQFQGTGDCINNTLSNMNFQSVWVDFEIAAQGTMWTLSCALFFLSYLFHCPLFIIMFLS